MTARRGYRIPLDYAPKQAPKASRVASARWLLLAWIAVVSLCYWLATAPP